MKFRFGVGLAAFLFAGVTAAVAHHSVQAQFDLSKPVTVTGTVTKVETFPDPLAALDAGKVTVVPGFTGRLLDRFAPGSAARSAEQVYRAQSILLGHPYHRA